MAGSTTAPTADGETGTVAPTGDDLSGGDDGGSGDDGSGDDGSGDDGDNPTTRPRSTPT